MLRYPWVVIGIDTKGRHYGWHIHFLDQKEEGLFRCLNVWLISLYGPMLMVGKWIFKSGCPVKHQGINACVHGMKLHLYQLRLELSMCQCRVENVTLVLRKIMPWTCLLRTLYLACKHCLLSTPLNRCIVEVSKHCSCPSPLLIFAPLILLLGHLTCNLFPRAESCWGVAATFLTPKTSAACLKPCGWVGKGCCQVDCFSILTESQNTALRPTGRW